MKNLIISLLCLLSACGSGSAEAASKQVQVRLYLLSSVQNPFYATEAAFLAARRLREQLGVKLRISAIIEKEDDFGTYTYEGWAEGDGYDHWHPRLDDRKLGVVRVVVAGPLVGPLGKEFFAGWAEATCRLDGGFIFVNVKDDFLKTALVITHELGHIFGANHVKSIPATIMHPAAGSLLGMHPDPEFHQFSYDQIQECQRKYSRKLRRHRKKKRRR